jgi:hypothetical protein
MRGLGKEKRKSPDSMAKGVFMEELNIILNSVKLL